MTAHFAEDLGMFFADAVEEACYRQRHQEYLRDRLDDADPLSGSDAGAELEHRVRQQLDRYAGHSGKLTADGERYRKLAMLAIRLHADRTGIPATELVVRGSRVERASRR